MAVNEVNEAIVPFTEPGNILREQHMKGNPLTHLITDRSASLLHPLPVCAPVSVLVSELPLYTSMIVCLQHYACLSVC